MTTGRHFAMGPDRMRVMRIDQEVRASSIFPVGGSAGHVLFVGRNIDILWDVPILFAMRLVLDTNVIVAAFPQPERGEQLAPAVR